MTSSTRIGWVQLAFISAGGLVWALHFVILYSYAALACAKNWLQPHTGLADIAQSGGVLLLFGFTTALALLINIIVVAMGFKRARGAEHDADGTPAFVPYAAAGIALLSTLAIILESFVFMLPVCS